VPRRRTNASIATNARWLASLLVVSALAVTSTSLAGESPDKKLESLTNEACQKCHGDRKSERKAPDARKPSVYIDSLGLARSEHRGMQCVDCHAAAFGQDPHPKARRAQCQDCHVANESGSSGTTGKDGAGPVRFADIDRDFQHSVHAQKSEEFRCIHCHDAHAFQLSTTRARVMEHNKICLRCHASSDEYQRFVAHPPPDLAKAHEWLPNRELHWSRVRCLDCHTGYDPPPGSHLILPRAQAVKRCEACHNQNPTQLLGLYGRMRGKEVASIGCLNSFIINDSYVIGATRNWWMDVGAIVIMGGTGAGIAGHGFLRVLAWLYRRRRGDGGHGPHGTEGAHGTCGSEGAPGEQGRHA
jgi:hypothetical protein